MLNWVTFSAVFGRRPIMLLACFILALGSIICAVSKSFTVMLIGRTVQGVGSGGFVAVVQVIITDMFPLRERAQYYALISTVYAIGSITAPIMGGALAQRRAWQVRTAILYWIRSAHFLIV
jgi:MFS family permease